MKTDIHPKYFDTAEIRCSCGNTIIAGSTKDKLKTELCSNCHPFYTGQQKLVDTAGRVDRFEARRRRAAEIKDEVKKQTEAQKKKPTVYKEKEVPAEVLQRAMGEQKGKGKWGAPLGESPAEEVVKEEVVATKKAKKTTPAKKPTAKAKSGAKGGVKKAKKK